MTRIWVTGTGTGVGKTIVTSTLIALARTRGRVWLPFKPVQTGWPAADDVDEALRAAGMHVAPGLRRLLSPFRYALPASPHLAARGRLTVARMARAEAALRPFAVPLIVEGAGGVLVPINRHETMRDLMTALPGPILLVGRAGLGTLNHVLLSVESLRQAGRVIAGIVLSQQPGEAWDRIASDNRRTLQAYTGLPVVRFAPVPRLCVLALFEFAFVCYVFN